MKIRALSFVLCLFGIFSAKAQNAYQIEVEVKGWKDTVVYLANHFGDKQYYKDTARFDSKGKAVFTGNKKLSKGIYLVVLPDISYFEIAMGDDQTFSIKTDKADLVKNMTITGSADNDFFYGDLRYLESVRKEFDELKKQLDKAKTKADSTLINEKIKGFDKTVKDNRKAQITANSSSVYAKILNAMQEVEIPDYNKSDSTFPYRYIREHYWDKVEFSEPGLLYSPIFHNKLSDWVKKWTYQIPDSIIVSCDVVLKKARKNEELFKYTLVWLLNEHAGSNIMCMDKVYVHLVNNYYAKGGANWVDKEQLEKIKKDAKALEPVVCGAKVPDIIAYNDKDKVVSLYQTKAKMTILAFWDSGCGHCKKTMPKIGKLLDAYKKHGLEVVAVTVQTEDEKEDWYKFIAEKGIANMINLHDFPFSNKFRLDYSIKSTPQIFLLDADKRVVAKKLSVGQMAEFLDREFRVNLKAPFVEMDKEEEKEEKAKEEKRKESESKSSNSK